MSWYPGSGWGGYFYIFGGPSEDLQVISNYKDMKHSVWGNAVLRNYPHSAHIRLFTNSLFLYQNFRGKGKYLN